MDVAGELDRALRAQGIPILGVRIGATADRSTWAIVYDPSATAQNRADGAALLASFDPTAPSVMAADLDAEATQAMSRLAKALCCEMLEQKLGRTLTIADAAAVQAM